MTIVPQTESSDLQPGWTSLPDGTMLREVTTFSQSDIDGGFIFYMHRSEDSQTPSDAFTFEVRTYHLLKYFEKLFFNLNSRNGEKRLNVNIIPLMLVSRRCWDLFGLTTLG